ncbi:hypothetical protein [Mycolicibacterium moriokaense]|uniref:hypothetical protein n=1 Tax=Mycolicibacterium moriokaense TaxID=39691 RepID=UPI000D753F29|nr:hypothetical protein [Mycolicibacterium moriokaense]
MAGTEVLHDAQSAGRGVFPAKLGLFNFTDVDRFGERNNVASLVVDVDDVLAAEFAGIGKSGDHVATPPERHALTAL